MSYNSKNYMQQGAEKWVIGGALEVLPGATVTGLPTAAYQADSVATTIEGLVTDFNALLAKLKASGLMADE
ncbi:Head fiber protein [Anaerocolumna sp. MB42-C2]|uniref:Head fiber protein n=1 Tax=Anaerocolumna sp. MB42-C2 TaxID=3070997 RepID=UPI0027DEE228|nr:Head fiber protein [Anaerocolumna sp. MB42-C2]WMJ87787.1 Head fiber protein [Anaerocolumna sp. MB42-C2]